MHSLDLLQKIISIQWRNKRFDLAQTAKNPIRNFYFAVNFRKALVWPCEFPSPSHGQMAGWLHGLTKWTTPSLGVRIVFTGPFWILLNFANFIFWALPSLSHTSIAQKCSNTVKWGVDMWIRDDGGHTINTRDSFESKGHFSDQEFANHPRAEYRLWNTINFKCHPFSGILNREAINYNHTVPWCSRIKRLSLNNAM